MTDEKKSARSSKPDALQASLNDVSRFMTTPGFLRGLTPSRLPSAAVSDASTSPTQAGARSPNSGLPRQSHLNIAHAFEEGLEHADLVAPLIQDPSADGSPSSIDPRVVTQLEEQFVGAHRAYADMASFQTFSHGHQDLVLAVDFNYFGTRMVTASSDHRLKVWDKKNESWVLVESWKAHDAEILDVSYLIISRTPRLGCAHTICHLCEPSLTSC
jgi:nucleoporin SEH1